MRVFAKNVFIYGFLVAAFSTLIFSVAITSVPHQQATVHTTVPPPILTTNTWGIFNPDTGVLIDGGQVDVVRPIASITKLFTAEAVLLSDKRNNPLTILDSDVAEEGDFGKLSRGTIKTPYELLFPLLIESSNDAAHAITRYMGTEYSHSIEASLNTLSLHSTTLVDGSGLGAKNVSTVLDLVSFYTHLRTTNPHILDITQLRMFVSDDTGYVNNNPARALENFTGGKHGYTDEANRTFIGTFKVSDYTGEIGIVLLGSSDLNADIHALLAYGESVGSTSDIMSP